MKKQVSSKIVVLVFSVLVVCFAIGFYTFAAWQEPTQTQPEGNVDAPLNVGSKEQTKSGNLVVNALGVSAFGNALLVPNGNVGIGTKNPSQKLDVVGNIVASGTICDSTGCIGDGGGGTYVSVWVAISSNGTVAFTHNLGTSDLSVTILFKPSSTGPISIALASEVGGMLYGVSVHEITNTQIKVSSGTGPIYYWKAGGSYGTTNSGYVKVLVRAMN